MSFLLVNVAAAEEKTPVAQEKTVVETTADEKNTEANKSSDQDDEVVQVGQIAPRKRN